MARRIQRSPQSAPDRPAGAQAPRSRKGGRVASGQVTQFTVQLATLSEAGIPVVRALTVLEGQARPGPFKDVLGEVTEDVASGMPLSDALGKHPRAFDALYSNMVHAGEAGGVLDLVLQRLAEFREKAEAIRSKLFGAMIYPIIVTCVATVFVAVAVLWLIPKFERIYKSFDFPLPRITTILLDISNFVIQWWYIVFLVPPLLLMLHFLLLRRSDGYRFRMHDWLLRVPLIGSLIQESLVGRFARTFGTLVQAGVPHLDSLEIVRDTTANDVLADAVEDIRRTVREGEGIARPMGESGMFDDVVVNMVDVGEQTGELDNMLLKVANASERRVDRRVDALMKLLEPMLILVMAVFVGFLVVALFLPLVGLMDSINSAS